MSDSDSESQKLTDEEKERKIKIYELKELISKLNDIDNKISIEEYRIKKLKEYKKEQKQLMNIIQTYMMNLELSDITITCGKGDKKSNKIIEIVDKSRLETFNKDFIQRRLKDLYLHEFETNPNKEELSTKKANEMVSFMLKDRQQKTQKTLQFNSCGKSKKK